MAAKAAHGAIKAAQPANKGLVAVRHTIAVSSAKGGVGKSTCSVNLAIALSAQHKRVGLLDADIFGPSIPNLMNLKGKRPSVAADKKITPLQNYGLKVMSSGFLIPQDQSIVWRGPMVMGAINQLLNDTKWDELDILVIDLPPGTGDIHLSITQNANLSGAVVVSTPQDIALIDARRGIHMFQKVNVPILGIIENMSYFICPNCDARHEIFGNGGAEETATDFGVPFLGRIPLHPDIRSSSDAGKPVTVTHPDGPLAAPYFSIAKQILANLEQSPDHAKGPTITMD
jgi:ATP-binding protein involved in chromosome partitioning